jgi:hypothetical protein
VGANAKKALLQQINSGRRIGEKACDGAAGATAFITAWGTLEMGLRIA